MERKKRAFGRDKMSKCRNVIKFNDFYIFQGTESKWQPAESTFRGLGVLWAVLGARIREEKRKRRRGSEEKGKARKSIQREASKGTGAGEEGAILLTT